MPRGHQRLAMDNDPRLRIRAHRDRESRMKRTIDTQEREIQRLRKAIRQLVDDFKNDASVDDNYDDTQRIQIFEDSYIDMELDELGDYDDERSSRRGPSDDQEITISNEGSDKIPLAVWDDGDDIYRCSFCSWEVFEGFCESCAMEHVVDEDKGKLHIGNSSSISTAHERINPDRRLKPRGSTPLREVGNIMAPLGYSKDEYRALLARGATKLMCETFSLEFTQENGIVAWADEELFRTFSGKAMENGDKWKICLGRRIELDDDDLDGAQFIEDLLEEVLLFPSSHLRGPLGLERAPKHVRWETVEESPGTWTTRPVTAHDPVAADSDVEDIMYEDCLCGDCTDAYDEDQDQPEITVKTIREEEADALEHTLPKENLGPVIEFEEYEDEEHMDDDDFDNEPAERVDDLLGWAGIYDPERGNPPGIAFEASFDQASEDIKDEESEREDLMLADAYPAQGDSEDPFDSDFFARRPTLVAT